MPYRTGTVLLLAALAWTGPAGAQVKPAGEVLSPKLVTFEPTKPLTISQALESVTYQTGIAVKDLRTGASDKPFQFKVLNKVRFWDVMDLLANQAGASLSLYRSDGVIGLVEGKPRA